MICLTDLYWCTDRTLVRYVLNHTDIMTYGMVERTNKLVYTIQSSPLSARYTQTVSNGMLWHNKPQSQMTCELLGVLRQPGYCSPAYCSSQAANWCNQDTGSLER